MLDEELDAFDESHALDKHAKVNGVEVSGAMKTSGQVGFVLDRRMSAGANRTAEAEEAVEGFRWDGQQGFNHILDGDMVAGLVQLSITESSAHQETSRGRRLTQFFKLTMWLTSVRRSINAAVR